MREGNRGCEREGREVLRGNIREEVNCNDSFRFIRQYYLCECIVHPHRRKGNKEGGRKGRLLIQVSSHCTCDFKLKERQGN